MIKNYLSKKARHFIVAEHMERLRTTELVQVQSYFHPKMRILEIGGGNGLQASKIEKWGCSVNSIDLASRENKSIYFDVCDYDGVNLPFEDNIFDIIFSSNVLEHVTNIDKILIESRRVLKHDGVAIHIMPTPAWRFWTIVSYYPYLIGGAIIRMITLSNFINNLSLKKVSLALPPPHGAFSSAFHELYYYSSRYWIKIFTKNGFQVSEFQDNGVFCSGYAIFANLKITMRKRLAKIFGSSGIIYIVRPIY